MQEKLDDMAYENQQMLLHTYKIIHLLPNGFDDKVKEVCLQIKILRATLEKV